MHILWEPDDPVSYYLYVGQSVNLEERIRKHNDPWYRARHPCLHYHVWDSTPDMESIFIVLASTDDDVPQLQLNLLELWCCLIFQTLPQQELRKYVSEEVSPSGSHLNVANPIWQSFTECKHDCYEHKERFKELIHSCDPLVADYYRSLAQGFRDLKTSSNPRLRAYYMAAYHRSQAGSAAAKVGRTFTQLLSGTEKTVYGRGSSQLITFGYVNFRISKKYQDLAHGAVVHAQGFLTDGANSHRYAVDALPEDPAIRFSFRIAGKNINGEPFGMFIHAPGEVTVKDINTLVDRLSGEDVDNIATKSRRMIPTDVTKGRYKVMYT
jgi:hypothetical protein